MNLSELTDEELSQLFTEINRELRKRKQSALSGLVLTDDQKYQIIERNLSKRNDEKRSLLRELAFRNFDDIAEQNKTKPVSRWKFDPLKYVAPGVKYMSSIFLTQGVNHRGPGYDRWYTDELFNYFNYTPQDPTAIVKFSPSLFE